MGPASLVTPQPVEAEPVVVARSVVKRYGRVGALHGVDLVVGPGRIYGLVGPDGAGKSSLLKCIAGVLSYEGGAVEVLGESIDSERAAERVKGRIGFMPQGLGNNLYPELSVEENVDYFGGLRLVPRDELDRRKERLLGVTRLAEFRERPMKNLSGGMKQKLGLVCTLIHEPELLLLDEPTTGVDPVSRREFWAVLTDLVLERAMTAIVATAYMDETAYMSEIAIVMGGRVVSHGREADIVALAPGAVVEVTVPDQLGALAKLRTEFGQVEASGPNLRVFLAGDVDARATERVHAALGEPAAVISPPRAPGLEDVLVHLLSRGRADASPEELDATRSGTTGVGPAGSRRAIEADDLVREFGAFRAVDGVSLRVDAGEIFGLLGANGAGKTTVIRMLTGLLPPTSGSGAVAGQDVARGGSDLKQRLGYMSQSFSLYRDLTVAENLELYAGIYGLSRRRSRSRIEWAVQIAELTGLGGSAAGSLPLGVRQRLALACALLHDPRVIFLDEPTSGVDVLGRRRFWDILMYLAREEGVAALVTTHYMSEAEHCDRLALMYAGRVVASGSPAALCEDLVRREGSPVAVEARQPFRALAAAHARGFGGATLFGRDVQVFTDDAERDGRALQAAIRDAGLVASEPRSRPVAMEDVFVRQVLAQQQGTRSQAGCVEKRA